MQPASLRTVAAGIVVMILPATASTAHAQQEPASAQANAQGPMIVERVHSSFAVAPEFKLTDFDGTTGQLAGGYGGWVFDDQLLIGGGGYWLANGSRGRRLAYGGAVVEWLQRTDHLLGFSVRGLVGFGEATISQAITAGGRSGDFRREDNRNARDVRDGRVVADRLLFRDDFFVAEPQGNLLVSLSRRIRVSVGAGYRLAGSPRGADDRIGGATGSIALQIGPAVSARP